MKLICLDLESPLPDVPPAVVGEQWVLVRLHRQPLGVLRLGRTPGIRASELARRIATELDRPIASHLAADGMARASSLDALLGLGRDCPRQPRDPRLTITVAVCTRDRAGHLTGCLDALMALDHPGPPIDRLVIDNAPRDAATARVVARYPGVRYVREPRPGLNRARNRAIHESHADIVAFADDDVRVDRGWAAAMAGAFESEPDTACVTGLVLPAELDTPAQVLFEAYGGFGRGFDRQVFRVDVEGGRLTAPIYGGTGRFGTGANMAFRRSAFATTGLFDPALDVGTPTNGGGDLEMFFRVLKSGASLVYEPRAMVTHRHRREYAALRAQVANNGIGFYAYLTRSARAFPEERAAIWRLGAWWFWAWSLRRLARSYVRPGAFPRDLILAELFGSVVGPRRYQASVAHAARIADPAGDLQDGATA